MNASAMSLLAPGVEIMNEFDFPQWDEDHPHAFRGIKWSRSGHALALYALEDPGFYVWDEQQARPSFRFGRFSGVTSLAWSSDDKYVAIGFMDGALLVHDARTGVKVWEANGDGEFDTWLTLDWLPDQDRIISMGTSRNMINLWKMGSDKPEETLEDRVSNPERLAISPDGTQVAYIADHLFVRSLLNKQTRRLEPCLNDICLDWSSDGELIVAGSRWVWPGIRVWNAVTSELLTTLQEPQGLVSTVCFSHDRQFLAAASEDNILRLWRTSDWQLVAQIPELTGGIGAGLSFHPKLPILAAGSSGGRKIRLWRYDSNRLRNA